MKKLALALLAIAALSMLYVAKAHGATTAPTPAPATCPASPCLQMTWTASSAAARGHSGLTRSANSAGPGTATMAVCIGSATGCGASPAAPGANGWLEYTVPQTTPAGAGIIPGLATGQLANVVVQFQWTGGAASAWSAPFQITVAPPAQVVPNAPTGLSGKQL